MLLNLIRYVPICTILLLQHLAQLAATVRIFSHLTNLPHLEFTNRDSYFLRSDEPWRPSGNTLVTALMAEKPLVIILEPHIHDVNVNSKEAISLYLEYKCFSTELGYKSVKLVSSGRLATNSTHCLNGRTFRIVSAENSTFNLFLLKDNNIPFVQAMNHILEFRVSANLHVGFSNSASLFVYNLDPLLKYNSTKEKFSIRGVNFTKYFLSEEALEFFSNLSPTNDSLTFQRLTLFENDFFEAYHPASILVRFTLAVSLIVRGDRLCTDPYDNTTNGDLVFTTGDSDPAASELAAKHLIAYIDLERNFLIFSASAVLTMRNFFMVAYKSKPVSLCLRISLNNPIWSYQILLTVATAIELKGQLPAVIDKKHCTMRQGYSWLILFEGMLNVILFNQIICHEMHDVVAIVIFNGKECINHISGTSQLWQKCQGGFRISNTGRAIQIQGPVTRNHAGAYKFIIKEYKYELFVTVLSLPTFNTPTETGGLPHTTHAILDTQITFNCTVFHDGMKHVNLVPFFRTLDLFKDTEWKEMSIHQFAIKVLQTSPNAIKVKITDGKGTRSQTSSLLITMPHVMRHWRTWLLTFTCRAYLPADDAKLMGLPLYYTETSTNVKFVGKRIFSSQSVSGGVSRPILLPTICVMHLVSSWLLLL